jgi:uncharacterized membrane protein YdjX (TVP38/TMEM64 family)
VNDDTAPGTRTDRWWFRPLILLVLLGIGVAVAVTVGIPPVEDIRAWVGAAGWAGPVAFAGLYAVLALTPTPATVLSIAAGLLFGVAGGLAVVMAGALLSAIGAFGLSRSLGRRAVERVDNDQLHRLDALFRRRGLLAVIGIRLVPLLPFSALNYLCGLTAVRTRDYIAGTAVGILPGATAYVAIGAFGAEPGSLPFLIAVGGLVALSLAGLVVARRRRAAEPAV